MANYNIKIVTGTSNARLARDVATNLGLELTPSTVGRFADGEIDIQIKESVRGSDVFIIQSTCPPDVNSAIQELVLLIHTLRLSSPARVTAIVPYYAYARQDRKNGPRVPISAAAVAKQILSMGPTRLLFIDLHCGQIQGFFENTPTDHLSGQGIIVQRISDMFDEGKMGEKPQTRDVVIVSPDAGGVVRARRFADALNVNQMATILKRRVDANKVDSMQLVGEISGRICIIVDDMIDTAGTLISAADLLISRGATSVFAVATHGIFSRNALERIEKSCLERVFVTDTISQTNTVNLCKKVECLSIAPLIAMGIEFIHNEQSVSAIPFGFDNSDPTQIRTDALPKQETSPHHF